MERGCEFTTMTRQQLIEDNMNLVYFVINKEYPTYKHDEDVIQSGMLGLCKAAEKWDEKKSKFSTYAIKWIRGEIIKEFVSRKPYSEMLSLDYEVGDDCVFADLVVGEEDVDYVDDSFYDILSQDEKQIVQLENEGYSTAEIAEVMGLTVQKVQQTIRRIRRILESYYENTD